MSSVAQTDTSRKVVDISPRSLSQGKGPPESPWFHVSESFFKWLQYVDLCPDNIISKGIRDIIDGGCGDDTIARLSNYRGGYFFCACRTCRKTRFVTGTTFILAPELNQSAVGRLLPHHEWPFDHQGGPGLVHWVARRLQEHYNHRHWVSSSAQFPLPGQQGPDHTQDALRSTNAFDPRLRESTDEVSAPWIRLIRYQLPEGDPPTNLMAKWLPYLYRGPVPEGAYRRFPPLNCALMTMLSEPEWRETATLQLFGTFDQCDVEILATYSGDHISSSTDNVRSDRPAVKVHLLKGISGVTVLFLSLVDSLPVIDLLASLNSGGPVVADLLRCFGTPMLPEDRPLKRASILSPTSRALVRLCRSSFLSTSPARRFSHRIMQLMQMWLSRPVIALRLSRSVTQDQDAMAELQPLFRLPFGFIDHESKGQVNTDSSGTNTTFQAYLSQMGIFYGCAIAAVVTTTFAASHARLLREETQTDEPTVKKTSTLTPANPIAGRTRSREAVCRDTHAGLSSNLVASIESTESQKPLGRLTMLLLSLREGVMSRIEELQVLDERISDHFKVGPGGVGFYGHLARSILELLPDEGHKAQLRSWLAASNNRAYLRCLSPPRRRSPSTDLAGPVCTVMAEESTEGGRVDDSVIDSTLSSSLSHGSGPPDSPWFFVSEFFFDWLQLVDTCLETPITPRLQRLVLRIYSGDTFAEFMRDLFDDFRGIIASLSHQPIGCRCPQCCGMIPERGAQGPAIFSPAPPIEATAKLLPHRDWPFDHQAGQSGIMEWVLKRLEEFIAMTLRDYAYFTTADVRSSQVLGVMRVVALAGEPGPFPQSWWKRRPFAVKLIDCRPPTAVLPSESFKWLQYLYQGKNPAEWHSQFPPMSSLISTLSDDPRWSCCEARALFANFHQCDVEVQQGLWEAGPKTCLSLKGINGLTVLFLSVSAFRSPWSNRLKDRLLTCLSCGSIIIGDFAQHRVDLRSLFLTSGGICKELEASVVNSDNHSSFEKICRHLVAVKRLGAEPFTDLGSPFGPTLLSQDRVASRGMQREPTADEDFRRLRQYAMRGGCDVALSVIAFVDKVNRRASPSPQPNQPVLSHSDLVAILTNSIIEVLLAGFKIAPSNALKQALKRLFQQRLSKISYRHTISVDMGLKNMKRQHMRELQSYDGLVNSELFFRYFAHAAVITFSAAEMNSHFRAVLDWFGQLDLNAMKESSSFGYSAWVPGLADDFYISCWPGLPYPAPLPTRLLKHLSTEEERDLMKQLELYLRVSAVIAARPRPWYASIVHHALGYRSPRLLAISDANSLSLQNARFSSARLSATARIIHQVPQFSKAATLALVTIALLALKLWSFYPSGAASSAA